MGTTPPLLALLLASATAPAQATTGTPWWEEAVVSEAPAAE